MSTIEHKGCTITIEQDDNPESPREWSTAALLHLGHRRYELPEEGVEADLENCTDLDSVRQAVKRANDAVLVLPVWGYDHGMLSIKMGARTYPFDCQWDSGLLGFVIVTKASVKENYVKSNAYPTQRSWAEAIAGDEVNLFNDYLTGQVFGWVARDAAGVEIGSCWGYFGSDDWDYMISEAKAEIDGHLEAIENDVDAFASLGGRS